MMAYKPAGDDPETMVVDAPCALRFTWTERNRRDSGNALRERLKKAVEYAKRWDEYETKLASWTPPKVEPGAVEAAADGEKKADGAEAKDGEKKDESADAKEGEKKDEKADADKKDAKKKKKGEEDPPKPITGAWEAKLTLPPFQEARIRLYVLDENGTVTGSLRCASLSDGLIQISGKRDGNKVDLRGEGTRGTVTVAGTIKEGKLGADVAVGGTTAHAIFVQGSTEYEVARPAEQRKPVEVKKAEIKGEPKSPGLDPDLEPLRRAMSGEAAVVVEVNREDEILACVDAFEEAGIQPVLYGAEEAWKVADEIQGRIAGILPLHDVVRASPETGARKRNRYAELVAVGIPVAFHSAAEEGAIDLPLMAAYAVSQGLGSEAALRALTSDAAQMLAIDDHVGTLAPGMDADILVLDGSPLSPSSSVQRVWVLGREVR